MRTGLAFTGLAFTGLVLILGLTACAGTSAGTSEEPLQANRMRLTAIEVADNPKTDTRYPVLLRYEANGDVGIVYTCFTWMDESSSFAWLADWTGLGNGPYCLVPESVEAPGVVTTKLVSGYAGDYELRAYVRYRSGGVMQTSNTVSSPVTLTRRYQQP